MSLVVVLMCCMIAFVLGGVLGITLTCMLSVSKQSDEARGDVPIAGASDQGMRGVWEERRGSSL
jgi:heme/copper-type cytochrome/quinol oxidase subunit 2